MRPLLQAEQAVLGAVLLDPGQLDHLDWLEPEHFYRPAHQALFAALRRLRADGQPVPAADGTLPLTWLTNAVAEASQHVHGLTAVYAHTLASACPRPSHAAVYGRMVLEGAIHRTVTDHAVRLHQLAHADQVRGGTAATLHQVDTFAAVLDNLAQRWGTEPRPTATSSWNPVGTRPEAGAVPVADDERLLLATLVNTPSGMAEVDDWLRPQDFAKPAHAQLYRCLSTLHHRGEPIDRMTLLWEAQRRGLLADGTVTCEQLTVICDGIGPGSATWLGEQVSRAALLRTAAASAHAIRDLATTDAIPPGRLINQALSALRAVDDVRQRWTTATGPAPPVGGEPATDPPPTQVRAARARSSPPMSRPAPTAAPSAVPPARPPSRSHT